MDSTEFLVLFACLMTAASAKILDCSMTCSPAPDITSRACNTTTGTCLYGCLEGFAGEYCSYTCPARCSVPTDNNKQTCDTLNGACLHGCLPGYGGDDCSYGCPENCMLPVDYNSRTCDAINDTCLYGCKYGFADHECNFSCPEHCGAPKDLYNTETCDSNTTYCLWGCEAGYAGDNCSVNCPSNCYGPPDGDDNAVCNASTMHCVFGCKDGFYGSQCSLKCTNAVSYCAVCHVGSDSNPVCIRCRGHFYLNNGQCKSCPYWCAEAGTQPCDPDSGECTHGCKAGRYGRYCDKYCSYPCAGGTCDQLTGGCTNGCDNVAYCGFTCQVSCGEGCLGKDCLQSCECRKGCYPEQWGDNCDKTCSLICDRGNSTNICGRADGSCMHGCLNQTWWGKTCDQKCPGFCSDSKCDKSTGECIHGCVNNQVYGPKCDQSCSSNCQNGTCRRDDGYCKEGCDPGWFGDKCDKLCGDNCVDRTCNRTNAYCKCEAGWHGLKCDMECGKTCLSAACGQDSGNCTYGCINGYEGAKCDKLEAGTAFFRAGISAYGGYNYSVLRLKASWAEALQYCKAIGSSLAVITSKNESDFVSELLTTEQNTMTTEQVWIGGTDLLQEGLWLTPETLEPLTYFNWAPGEPDNLGGQHCLAIINNRNLQWDDKLCEMLNYALCKAGSTRNSKTIYG